MFAVIYLTTFILEEKLNFYYSGQRIFRYARPVKSLNFE